MDNYLVEETQEVSSIKKVVVENNNTNRVNLLVSFIPFSLFVISIVSSIVYIILGIPGDNTTLVIIESVLGCFACFSFQILEKAFKIKTSTSLRMIVMSFALLAIFFGEALNFYYLIEWWDTMLHTLSGFLVCMVGYGFAKCYLEKKGVKSFVLAITIGFMFSLSVALLWEVYEFTVDSLFGTNMQKVMPEIEGIFNGGNTSLDLIGDEQLVLDFYKTPHGYRYAILDTMKDMIVCLIGTVVFVVTARITSSKNVDPFSNLLEF